MAKANQVKTNAMRLLERGKVAYTPVYYDLGDTEFSGAAVSELTGIAPERSFKTLCARGDRRGVLVFLVPVALELDLKLAAQAAGEKKVELTPIKDLLALTGYVRGCVSPIGMKKTYPAFLDCSALQHGEVAVSAGAKGASLLVNPQALLQFLGAECKPLTRLP